MSEAVRANGRRERNKARTREALQSAARRLFTERGYAETTVGQIAEAADVSERTFFRYFDAKEDLLLPDLAAFFASIEAELRRRPVDEHPLDAYLAALLAVVGGQAVTGGMTTFAPGLDPADPAVVAHLARSFVNWEARLTAILAERIRAAAPATGGSEADDSDAGLLSSVTANIAVATTRGAMRVIRGRAGGGTADRMAILTDAFAIARSGCTPPPRRD